MRLKAAARAADTPTTRAPGPTYFARGRMIVLVLVLLDRVVRPSRWCGRSKKGQRRAARLVPAPAPRTTSAKSIVGTSPSTSSAASANDVANVVSRDFGNISSSKRREGRHRVKFVAETVDRLAATQSLGECSPEIACAPELVPQRADSRSRAAVFRSFQCSETCHHDRVRIRRGRRNTSSRKCGHVQLVVRTNDQRGADERGASSASLPSPGERLSTVSSDPAKTRRRCQQIARMRHPVCATLRGRRSNASGSRAATEQHGCARFTERKAAVAAGA